MFSTVDGEPLAIVVGGESNGEILFWKDPNLKTTSVLKEFPHKETTLHSGHFEMIPNPKVRIIFVAASSGAGKTSFCAKYAEKYLKLHPSVEFHLFSQVEEDESIDYLKPHRIMMDQSIVENPIELDEIEEHTLLMFDDFDTITDKAVQKAVDSLISKVLKLGRHKDIKVLITSHQINPNNKTLGRDILNEMQCLVCFPSSGSKYYLDYCLKRDFGMSAKQKTKIHSLDSRWVCLLKNYPQVVLSEKYCTFVKDL